MRNETCPECEDILVNKSSCHCGWSKGGGKVVVDRRCHYENNGVRCPLAGSMSNTSNPTIHTRGYCRHHINWFDNPRVAAMSLDEIISGKVKPDRNWRDDIIKEFQTKHPEFAIVPKNKEEARELLAMVVKYMENITALPYDKRSRLAEKSEEFEDGDDYFEMARRRNKETLIADTMPEGMAAKLRQEAIDRAFPEKHNGKDNRLSGLEKAE